MGSPRQSGLLRCLVALVVLLLHLTNLHGDIVATTPVDGSAAIITDYSENTEYGSPRDSASAKSPYGWLGSRQRSSDALGGLVLMGVRLYNPSTGRFLSNDPVRGGNATAYGSPLDPVNNDDTSGACPCLIPVIPVVGAGVGAALTYIAGAIVIAGIAITLTETAKAHGFTVPFPGNGTSKKGKGYYTYVIKHRKSIKDTHWYVWKYGMTGVGPNRPTSQIGQCSRMSAVDPCIWNWVVENVSKWAARAVEAQLIWDYLVRWGHCPPGHNPGSRKICT
ncbi:RHS repeat-associated core domain-containing protein [Nocardioides sp. BYT-33-1]|uniref:RHS repeat-associated core domain-containing protein n=1 Tax=Nocardioides sp. BYT-33-1 TaxID=3416952 RepID=UPI003F5302DB